MDNVNRYPQEILDLDTPEGFNERFEEELSKFRTQEEAYKEVERIYCKFFDGPKYKSLDSFRQSRKYLRKRSRVKHG